jgi:hypothetical protein
MPKPPSFNTGVLSHLVRNKSRLEMIVSIAVV